MKSTKYTKEEILDLIQFFRESWKYIPESIQIDQCTNIPNLRDTLPKLIECAKLNWHKPYFGGYIEMLYKIKRLLVNV